MKDKTSTTDRREFERFPADLSLLVTRETSLPGLKTGEFEARLVDLSRNGVRFTSTELFHRGEQVSLFHPGTEQHPGLHVEVKIVRAERVPGQKYEIAARITRQLLRQEKFGASD